MATVQDNLILTNLLSVTLLSPNGGETLQPGTSTLIQWQSLAASKHGLKYSLDGGTNYIDIVNDLPGSQQSYAWIVPNVSSTNVRVRVASRDAANNRVTDDSDGVFTIAQTQPLTVQVTAPNGGQNFAPGQQVLITWNSTGAAAHSVKYSLDNGVTYVDIVNELPGTQKSYTWTVPNVSSTVARIRVAARDAANTRVTDDSDGVFTIAQTQPLTVQVTAPNGGQNFAPGQQVLITWNSTGAAAHSVKYSLDNGVTYVDIVNELPGTQKSYTWTVPNVSSTVARIRVAARDAANTRVTDDSDGVFTIAQTQPLTVQVTAPNGGQSFAPGQQVLITWTSTGAAAHSVKYSLDNGATYVDIVNELPGTQKSYTWTVPNVSSTVARIRVAARDAANTRVTDDSDGVFTIAQTQPLTVQVTAPNGGQSFAPGQQVVITWNSTGAAAHSVKYSLDNGVTYVDIVNELPGTQKSYTWTVPNVSSTVARIRVAARDAANTRVTDDSDGVFTIAGGTTQGTVNVRSVTVVDPDDPDVIQPLAAFSEGQVSAGKRVVVMFEYITFPAGIIADYSLSAVGMPDTVSVTFSPNPTQTYTVVTMVVDTAASTPPGTYTFTVVPESSDPFAVFLPFDFLLRVDPPQPRVAISTPASAYEVNTGGAVLIPVTLKRRAFPGLVPLLTNFLPSTITPAFVPNPVSTDSAVLTLVASPQAVAGSYPFEIAAMLPQGVVLKSAKPVVTVKAVPVIGVSVSDQDPTKAPGALRCGSFMVGVATNNVADTIEFRVQWADPSIASNVMVTFDPAVVTVSASQPNATTRLLLNADVRLGLQDFQVVARRVSDPTVQGISNPATLNVPRRPFATVIPLGGMPPAPGEMNTPVRINALAGTSPTLDLETERGADVTGCMRLFDGEVTLKNLSGPEPDFGELTFEPPIIGPTDSSQLTIPVKQTAKLGETRFTIGGTANGADVDPLDVIVNVTRTVVTIDVVSRDPNDFPRGFERVHVNVATAGADRAAYFIVNLKVGFTEVMPVRVDGPSGMAEIRLPNPASTIGVAIVDVSAFDAANKVIASGTDRVTVLRTERPTVLPIQRGGIVPSTASVGQTITITGTDYVQGETIVFFTDGSNASAPSLRADEPTVVPSSFGMVMTVPVPAGAVTGSLLLRNPDVELTTNASISEPINIVAGGITPPPASEPLTVGIFTPTTGPVGTPVTINGTGFTRVRSVLFNGVPASFTPPTEPHVLTAVVPAGATTGPITVTTAGGEGTSRAFFQVTRGIVIPPRVIDPGIVDPDGRITPGGRLGNQPGGRNGGSLNGNV